MKAKNLKEFKALIRRYESITLEEIKEAVSKCEYWWDVANYLTGFDGGIKNLCTLCTPIQIDCTKCVYNKHMGCLDGKNALTFNRILSAGTPVKLRNAYRARAKHMKTLLKTKS